MIRDIKEEEKTLINDDPVRPHIPVDWRTKSGRRVLVLESEPNKIDAIICVAFTNDVPITEEDLNNTGNDVAVFYTVWSYSKGSGRDIVNLAAEKVKKEYVSVNRMVTLSPLTEMAEKFHLSNGAKFLRKGDTCQNFEYLI